MNYARATVCITDSGIGLKSGSDAPPSRPCDNLMHPAGRGAHAYPRRLAGGLMEISQITESLSVTFKCRRPSTAPATVNASASASVMYTR